MDQQIKETLDKFVEEESKRIIDLLSNFDNQLLHTNPPATGYPELLISTYIESRQPSFEFTDEHDLSGLFDGITNEWDSKLEEFQELVRVNEDDIEIICLGTFLIGKYLQTVILLNIEKSFSRVPAVRYKTHWLSPDLISISTEEIGYFIQQTPKHLMAGYLCFPKNRETLDDYKQSIFFDNSLSQTTKDVLAQFQIDGDQWLSKIFEITENIIENDTTPIIVMEFHYSYLTMKNSLPIETLDHFQWCVRKMFKGVFMFDYKFLPPEGTREEIIRITAIRQK